MVASSGFQEAGVFVYVPHPDAAVNIQGFSPQDPPLNRLLKRVLQENCEFQEPQTGAAFVAPTEVLIALGGNSFWARDSGFTFTSSTVLKSVRYTF